MRVTTSQIFNSGSRGIQRNQSDLFKLQNQLSTGRRILAPEDDPVAASQALVVTQSRGINAQYLDNQGSARDQLSLVENKLNSVGQELQNIFERTVQAGNGTLSSEQRGMIAQELRGSLDNVVSLANSQDGNGLYIFSGFQAHTEPFAVAGNPSPYSLGSQYLGYQGDDGQRLLQVSPSQEMAITETGSEVFMRVRDGQGNLTGRSMFDSIKNLIDTLDPATAGVTLDQNAYRQAMNDMNAVVAHVSRVRTSVGARLASLDSLQSSAQDLNLQYDQRLSELQDLDYSKAISDLSQQQIQLEAAQKSFKQTSQLSLFDIL